MGKTKVMPYLIYASMACQGAYLLLFWAVQLAPDSVLQILTLLYAGGREGMNYQPLILSGLFWMLATGLHWLFALLALRRLADGKRHTFLFVCTILYCIFVPGVLSQAVGIAENIIQARQGEMALVASSIMRNALSFFGPLQITGTVLLLAGCSMIWYRSQFPLPQEASRQDAPVQAGSESDGNAGPDIR